MEITEAQFSLISSGLPRERGNVKVSHPQFLNVLLYVAEHGCKWRGLPKRFGPWHTIYTEVNIHDPTESSLLGDGTRVLTRIMKQIRALVGERGHDCGMGCERSDTG